MKKITFLLLAMLVGFFMQAQRVTDVPFMQASKTKMVFKSQQRVQSLSPRAIGDTIWSDDFSDVTKWKMYSGDSSDYTGDWVIQNTDNPNFGYKTGTIHSTTWQNGYAAFDADANGADGMNDASNEYIEYVKPIDCSSLESVALVGQQYGRKWKTTRVFVEVSKDSINWTSFELEPALPLSTVMADTFFMVNISSVAAHEDSVYLRFHFQGGWDYGWCFDDLAFIQAPMYDLAGIIWDPISSHAGIYSELPMKQAAAISEWKVTVQNAGAKPLTGTRLNVSVLDGNGDTVHSFVHDTLMLAGLDTFEVAEYDTLYAVADADVFIPDTTKEQTYTINMSVACNELDSMLSNNTRKTPYTLAITDTTISRTIDITSSVTIGRFTSAQSGDLIGTLFYLPNPDTVGSMSFYISSATDTEDVSFEISLSMWDGSAWVNDVVTSADPVPVTSDMLGTWVTVPFDYNTFDRTIEGGTWYIAAVKQNFNPSSQSFYIGANNTDPHDYQNSSEVYIGGSWGYTTIGVPAIKLNFHRTPVGIHEVQISDNPVNVYPNPAMNQLHINGVVEGSTIEIYNMLGAEVASIAHANASNTMSVSELPAGNYIVKIINNNQVVTRKIAIVK